MASRKLACSLKQCVNQMKHFLPVYFGQQFIARLKTSHNLKKRRRFSVI